MAKKYYKEKRKWQKSYFIRGIKNWETRR